MPALRQGDVIAGQWRLERKLGQGGMGTVLLAHDLALGRKVAVKLLADHLSGNDRSLERFEREARLTAGFDHPNIIAIYGVGRHEARPYIVMKYLDGAPLSQLPEGRLEVRRAVAAFEQLCAGLGYIHGKGYVHRDVKPANVFLSSAGHLTLLDFGILKDLSTGDTSSGLLLGTLPYMSPEQLLGSQNIDHRTDLYSAAVVLYELITGARPFENVGTSLLDHVRARSELPDVRTHVSGLSESWARVFSKGLAVAPADRFATANEFAAAVRQALGSPLVSGPPREALPAGRPAHVVTAAVEPEAVGDAPPRRAWPRVAVGLAFLLSSVGLGLGLWLPKTHRADGALMASHEVVIAPRSVRPQPAPVVSAADVAKPSAPQPQAVLSPTRPPPSPPTRHSLPGRLQVLTLSGGEPRWATLEVDGRSQGTTPVSLPLPPGRHRIRLGRPGLRAVDQTVMVRSGKTSTLRVELPL